MNKTFLRDDGARQGEGGIEICRGETWKISTEGDEERLGDGSGGARALTPSFGARRGRRGGEEMRSGWGRGGGGSRGLVPKGRMECPSMAWLQSQRRPTGLSNRKRGDDHLDSHGVEDSCRRRCDLEDMEVDRRQDDGPASGDAQGRGQVLGCVTTSVFLPDHAWLRPGGRGRRWRCVPPRLARSCSGHHWGVVLGLVGDAA
nr:hypothetical protein CFP56_36311 [Quercus suber]